MDKTEQILEKLEKMEERICRLEGRQKPDNSKIVHKNIIDPCQMEEGRMGYVGNYRSKDGTMTSRFGAENNSINALFQCNSFEMAKVIDAFSSEERINIVKELIQNSLTAKELMERLQFSTTGKLYHHLSFLEKVGVIRKDGEQFHVSAKYISCVLLIFTGVEKIVRNSSQDN